VDVAAATAAPVELFCTADFTTADQTPSTVRIEEIPNNGTVYGMLVAP
jgi:hypothetical protein